MCQGHGPLVIVKFTNNFSVIVGVGYNISRKSEYCGSNALTHDAVDVVEAPSKVFWNAKLPELLRLKARLTNLTEHRCFQKPTAIIKLTVRPRAYKDPLFHRASDRRYK